MCFVRPGARAQGRPGQDDAAARRRAESDPGPIQSHVGARPRLAGPRRLPSGGSRQIPRQGQAAGDGVGRRRLRHQQRALLGLFHDDRVARLPGDRQRAGAGRRATAAERRRSAQSDRVGGERKRARRLAAQRQSRSRARRRDGAVVRRISLHHAGLGPAREDHRRLQLRRAARQAGVERGRAAEGPRSRAADQRRRTRLPHARVTHDIRAAQERAGVLRRPPRRGPHRHRGSPGRRRICERRVELAALAVQERQESGGDVRRRQVRALHQQQLGRSRERIQRRA